jgi:hypothetical protein
MPRGRHISSRAMLLVLTIGGSMPVGACSRPADIAGSWIVTNTPADGADPPFLSMATFTDDGRYIGAAQGSGACCPILTPGHGEWRRADGGYIVTFVSVGYDASGDLIGRVTGRLEIRMESPADHFEGEFAGAMIDPSGAIVFSTAGNLRGDRIRAGPGE